VAVSAEPNATGSDVELVSREWDDRAQAFLGSIT